MVERGAGVAKRGDSPQVERRSPLRVVLDTGPDPYLVLDPLHDESGSIIDLRLRFANPAAAERLGPAAGISGAPVLDRIPQLDPAAILGSCSAVMRTGTPSRLEVGAASGGAGTGVEIRLFKLGEHLGLIWRELPDPAAADPVGVHASQVLQAAPVAMAILALAGQVLRANDALLAMLDASDATGVNGADLGLLLHEDDRERFGTGLRSVAGGLCEQYVDRVRCHLSDDRLVWADLRIASVHSDGGIRCLVAQLVDVTNEVGYLDRMRRSEERLRLALEAAPGGIAFANSEGELTLVNPALCRMLGRPAEQILGRRLSELLAPDEYLDVDQFQRTLAASPPGLVSVPHTHHLQVDGRDTWLEHTASRLADGDAASLFIHQFHDQSAIHALQVELRHRADHDPLTGVANREGLLRRLADRRRPRPADDGFVAVLFMDIDHFKEINDTHGHAAGDAVLMVLAQRISARLRRGDFVARFGGDEFIIVLDRLSDMPQATAVAQKLRAVAREPVVFEGRPIFCSISIGVTLAAYGEDPDLMLRLADRALYRAKQGGRDRVEVTSSNDPGI